MFVLILLLAVIAQTKCQHDAGTGNNNDTIHNGALVNATTETYSVWGNNSNSDVEMYTKLKGPLRSSSNFLNANVSTRDYTSASAALFYFGGENNNTSRLFNAENELQRQLREKAKLDSLESIKIHILMRLKLSKLPNITTPIPVPQKILEHFYKNYYTSYANNTTTTTSRRSLSTENEKRIKSNSGRYHQNHPFVSNTDEEEGDAESSDVNFSRMQQDSALLDNRDDINHLTTTGGGHDDILSHIKTIYVFPNKLPLNHQAHKTEALHFKFDMSYSEIYNAYLHLYIRGWEWMRLHNPNIYKNAALLKQCEMVIVVHRTVPTLQMELPAYKLKVLEFHYPIPIGEGQWIKINAMKLFDYELASNRNYSSQDLLLIRGAEPWMKAFIVTFDEASSKNPLTVHVEIQTRIIQHRSKRSTFLDCNENDREVRCCRYPLRVNFTTFGWHFVVAPTSFDAFFCNGECKVGYLEQYTHTHLASLTTSATPCCSPTKMSALSLLYFDENHKLVLSVIPNMSVEKCSCS